MDKPSNPAHESFVQKQTRAWKKLSDETPVLENRFGISFFDILNYNEAGCVNADLSITGLKFVRFGGYSLLERIWWKLRKDAIRRICKNNSVIYVNYDDLQETIFCKFMLEYSLISDGHIGPETYNGLFVDTFKTQVTVFENVILQFLENENGYAAYLAYGNEHPHAHSNEFDRIIDNFLISLDLVKPKREKKSAKKS